MQKSSKIPIVICADLNLRASIAVMRALKHEDVDLIIGVSGLFSAFLTAPSLCGRLELFKKMWIYNSKSEELFIKSLGTLGSTSPVPLLFFPMGEKVLRWVIKNRLSLRDSNVIVPNHEIKDYERVSDKYSFIELCRDFKLDVPDEFSEVPNSYRSPYVIKARKITWGKHNVLEAPALINSVSAHQYIQKKKLNSAAHIFQEYISGPSFYYCVLYSDGNRILRFVQQTIIQQPGGKSVVCAAPSSLPQLVTDSIDNIFKSINWSGVLMVELKQSGDKFYIIECNPRLWGPLQCAVDNGVNFPLMLYKLMVGKEIEQGTERLIFHRGFIWVWGLIDGIFHLFSSKTGFQFYPLKVSQFKFSDVWFRRDSLIYFFFEPFVLILQWIILYKKIVLNKLKQWIS